MNRRAFRRGKKSRGQSLVEFTLALPIFLALLIAIAEGGYYVVATTAVSHATYEGARLGVLETTPDIAAIRTRVREQAAAVISLTDDSITLELNGSACDDACYAGRVSGDQLGVITEYSHHPILSYVFNGITFQANARAELLVE
jgi:Flp pilus assembly protein TadG